MVGVEIISVICVSQVSTNPNPFVTLLFFKCTSRVLHLLRKSVLIVLSVELCPPQILNVDVLVPSNSESDLIWKRDNCRCNWLVKMSIII